MLAIHFFSANNFSFVFFSAKLFLPTKNIIIIYHQHTLCKSWDFLYGKMLLLMSAKLTMKIKCAHTDAKKCCYNNRNFKKKISGMAIIAFHFFFTLFYVRMNGCFSEMKTRSIDWRIIFHLSVSRQGFWKAHNHVCLWASPIKTCRRRRLWRNIKNGGMKRCRDPTYAYLTWEKS